ncbi:hypothetical protein CY35_16G065900 [Sphagnum magellanicum]|nr:hypothetical protein CY35_16G065900 [Sphagnum magellanicum]
MADSSDGGARVLEKPSRSEEQLDLSAGEYENRTEVVHQKLEALLPKRPLKPARSEAQQLAAAVQESETPPSFQLKILKIHKCRMSILNYEKIYFPKLDNHSFAFALTKVHLLHF